MQDVVALRIEQEPDPHRYRPGRELIESFSGAHITQRPACKTQLLALCLDTAHVLTAHASRAGVLRRTLVEDRLLADRLSRRD